MGGKGLTTDAGMRVPVIANWKGVTPHGRVLHDLVDSTDFLPTMFDAIGAKLPAGRKVDGQSFLPQLRGGKGTPRQWMYCHYDPRPGHDKEQFHLQKFARDQRFKLYSDGRMFEIDRDVLEQHPLASDKALAVRKKLQRVIDHMAMG